MGREVVRVPPDFVHPTGEDGGFTPGAHFELLYNAGEEACTAFQIYENVSEGTPVSPVFATPAEMSRWLVDQGYEQAAADAFIAQGFAPLLVVSPDAVVDGIAAAAKK